MWAHDLRHAGADRARVALAGCATPTKARQLDRRVSMPPPE